MGWRPSLVVALPVLARCAALTRLARVLYDTPTRSREETPRSPVPRPPPALPAATQEIRMRFSFWPIARRSFDEVLSLARHAERAGWDGIWYADHFMPNEPDPGAEPCHEV